MSEKKSILPVIALIVAILALAAAVFAIVSRPADNAAEIEALKQENANLKAQVSGLNSRLDSLNVGSGLSDWNLVAVSWEDGMGANVTMSAAPGAYEDGMEAIFSIRLNGQEVSSVPCEWDGSAFFTATAKLESADGYSYYCIIINAEGERQQFALSTTENPVYDVPVYLESSLNAYCKMILDSWLVDNGKLTISLAELEAQLPRLTSYGEMPTIDDARLLLVHNGQDFSSLDLTLEPDEGAGAYKLTLAGGDLNWPVELEEGDNLDLYFEIVLSDGLVLSDLGGSWLYGDGGLDLVVG